MTSRWRSALLVGAAALGTYCDSDCDRLALASVNNYLYNGSLCRDHQHCESTPSVPVTTVCYRGHSCIEKAYLTAKRDLPFYSLA